MEEIGTASGTENERVRGAPKRLLFVCTANQHRSRTAEALFRRTSRYEARSAGTDVSPREPEEQPVTEELLSWADVVFVMEPYHRDVLHERFPGRAPKIVVLDIEDRYLRGDPDLVRTLKKRVSPHLEVLEGGDEL